MLVRKFEFYNDKTKVRSVLSDDLSVQYKSPPEGSRFLRKWTGNDEVANVVKEIRKSDSTFVKLVCQKQGFQKLYALNHEV